MDKMKRIINIALVLIVGVLGFIPFNVLATTDTYYSGSSDVQIYATNAVWANAQGATTGAINSGTYSKVASGIGYSVYRGFLYFDTSAIPDGALITLATLSLYGYGTPCKVEDDAGQADIMLYEGTQSNPAVADDFNNFGGVLLTAGAFSYDYDTFLNSSYNDATLNAAGIAVINKTGTTKFALRIKGDVDNIAPTGFNYIQYFNGSSVVNKPKLYIEYVVYPTVTTQAVNNIIYSGGAHYALLNGNVTSNGGNTTDIRGFVYGITSVPVNPGHVLPPASGYSTNSTTYSSSLGAYTSNITGMVAGTKYYVRAIAHNGVGWSYGDEVNFTTLTDPSITTLAASNIATTVARLNSSVVNDGGGNCVVVFVYKSNAGAHYANYAAVLAAGGTEVTATGTYNTGALPYYDISGLTAGTNYDFAVKITNSVSTQYGSVLYFTTESGIYAPTNFVAITTSTTVSLSWIKGVGASNTYIRYDTSTYPTLTTDGISTVYAGTGSACVLTGLTPGQNYYYTAWGLTGGLYSASGVSVLGTCLSVGATSVPLLPVPITPGSWSNPLSDTAIANLPFHEFAENFADRYGIPRTTLWYGLWIMLSITIGLFVYWKGNQNLLVALLACGIGLIIGSILGLVYLWVAVFFLIGGISIAWLAQRYS